MVSPLPVAAAECAPAITAAIANVRTDAGWCRVRRRRRGPGSQASWPAARAPGRDQGRNGYSLLCLGRVSSGRPDGTGQDSADEFLALT